MLNQAVSINYSGSDNCYVVKYIFCEQECQELYSLKYKKYLLGDINMLNYK